MSEMVVIAAIVSVAATIIAAMIWRDNPPPYSHRRVMQSDGITHVREGSGPDPNIVMDMIMTGRYTMGGENPTAVE